MFRLIDLSNKLDSSNREPLKLCGQKLKLLGEVQYTVHVRTVQVHTVVIIMQHWMEPNTLVQADCYTLSEQMRFHLHIIYKTFGNDRRGCIHLQPLKYSHLGNAAKILDIE